MDDPAYKRLLEHRRIVSDLLTGFIAPRRGARWAAALRLRSLRAGPTENVTDLLRRRLGDVVWSVDRDHGRHRAHTLHLVIEHQSSVDHAMPLRFLNYASLLYQRRYRDVPRWRRGRLADPVLHVVVYNGEAPWDAPLTLAEMVARSDQDAPPHLALRYEVLDLARVRPADLPEGNLLRWIAAVEQSAHAGALPRRVRELGEWLALEGEPGLTRTFDLWLGALGRKWGLELPSIRRYEEGNAVLLKKIDQWEAEFLERGREQGLEQGREQGLEQGLERGAAQQRALLCRLAAGRFGADTADRLALLLAPVSDPERLAEIGDWLVRCESGDQFLARVSSAP